MEIRTVDECFRLRLLRSIPPDEHKSKRSLELAEQRLRDGGEALKLKFFSYAVLEAYMAMFHAARALLYRDGIQEKSHFAIGVYLREKYAQKVPLAITNLLNIHRIERHEAMYGLEYKPNEQDASLALEDAQTFIQHIKKVL